MQYIKNDGRAVAIARRNHARMTVFPINLQEDFRIRPAYLATSWIPTSRAPCSYTPYLDRKIRLEGFVHRDDVWVAHIELCKVTLSRREEEQTEVRKRK